MELEYLVLFDLRHAVDSFNQCIVPVHVFIWILIILVAKCEDDSDRVGLYLIDDLLKYGDVVDVVSLRSHRTSKHQ